ncbi:polyprenol phosphomannose-dependent alpha 1,6 mannosyltransferase MptB [Microbispora sp. RL4-1S]|uniref:Polyprenol phosphomannose-dependent alpha 1,6 mannosyltransferase MptB n=1 Tax=Microbispora oryzae TaxID=2806554 RepID=A0A940WIF0_9ACTN|nr:polyprenol phosphomannose-dependent alpha 1,6 mannosyltransferase MptB [Microbispora oryzae]
MVPELPGAPWQPPYSLGLAPGGHLVVALGAVAIILGGAGLAAGLAVPGRLPRPRVLLLAGCLAAAVLTFLPPSGSSDHLNYAAYGRMAALGYDPYVTVAADLPADPLIGRVEEWRGTPSVYGPVATIVQSLAAHVGGDSLRLTVFALELANLVAFVAAALVLHRATRDDPVRQARAALLWTVNPLLLYQLAAGMHLDTLAIALVVGGLVARRGVLLGLGVAVKVTAGLVALGTAWELRRQPGRLALVAVSATATVVTLYWLAGPHALDQVLDASKTVSLATPWMLVKRAAQSISSGSYHALIQIGSLLLMAVLAVLLLRRLSPGDADAPGRHAAPSTGPAGAGVALALTTAWLFATPYALPWYDGLAFALVALVPATGLDGFLTARLTALSLAYLPARQAGQPADLEWLVSVVRSLAVPAFLLALTACLIWWAVATRAPAPGQTPRESAVRPPSGPSPGSRSRSR